MIVDTELYHSQSRFFFKGQKWVSKRFILQIRGAGTPPLAWVGGGDYSDMGVWNKCLDCAKEKRRFLNITSQKRSYIHYTNS